MASKREILYDLIEHRKSADALYYDLYEVSTLALKLLAPLEQKAHKSRTDEDMQFLEKIHQLTHKITDCIKHSNEYAEEGLKSYSRALRSIGDY